MGDQGGEIVEAPWTGAISAGGFASLVRIPIPGTNGLAIELSPRNFKGHSTSTLFIQDGAGRRVLRLDFGHNVKTDTINFHWNQKGTFADFGIADHAVAGRTGAGLYRFAQGFRYAGRVLMVVGVICDTVSIVQSSQPLRRSAQVLTAWAMATAGAAQFGAIGAGIGTMIEPGGGTALVGLVFGIGGGIAGYLTGEAVATALYDWGQATFFPLPKVSEPGP